MKTKEPEIFYNSGKPIVTMHQYSTEHNEPFRLFKFHSEVLNKEELNELVNWLISKMDEL